MTDEELQKRAAYTEGLRRLADVLDANPDLPLVSLEGSTSGDQFSVHVRGHGHGSRGAAAEAFGSVLRALNGTDWQRDEGSGNFTVRGRIAGLWVGVFTGRDHLVERTVIDRREVDGRVIETVEWFEPSVESLLAGGEPQ